MLYYYGVALKGAICVALGRDYRDYQNYCSYHYLRGILLCAVLYYGVALKWAICGASGRDYRDYQNYCSYHYLRGTLYAHNSGVCEALRCVAYMVRVT